MTKSITREPHPPIEDHFAQGKAIAREWFRLADVPMNQYREYHFSKFEGHTDFMGERPKRFAAWQAGFDAGIAEILADIANGG